MDNAKGDAAPKYYPNNESFGLPSTFHALFTVKTCFFCTVMKILSDCTITPADRMRSYRKGGFQKWNCN